MNRVSNSEQLDNVLPFRVTQRRSDERRLNIGRSFERRLSVERRISIEQRTSGFAMAMNLNQEAEIPKIG